MRNLHPVLKLCAGISAFLLGGCQPTSIPSEVIIKGTVVGGHTTVSHYRPHSLKPSIPVELLPGARVFLSSDREGKGIVSPFAVADKDGNFELKVDTSRVREDASGRSYWLVVEHERAYSLITDSFNIFKTDNQHVMVLLKLP